MVAVFKPMKVPEERENNHSPLSQKVRHKPAGFNSSKADLKQQDDGTSCLGK